MLPPDNFSRMLKLPLYFSVYKTMLYFVYNKLCPVQIDVCRGLISIIEELDE